MSEKYERLKTLLLELFQLDQPDLDFGLYRIMHAKTAEVTKFLDEDLLPQVKEALAGLRDGERPQIEKELAKAIESAEELGVDPETTQKVKDFASISSEAAMSTGSRARSTTISRSSLATTARATSSASGATSDRVYAIPYEGEEVSSTGPTRTSTTSRPASTCATTRFRSEAGRRREPDAGHFRLVDADRRRARQRQGRRGQGPACSCSRQAVSRAMTSLESDGELVIDFEFRPTTMATGRSSEDRRRRRSKRT